MGWILRVMECFHLKPSPSIMFLDLSFAKRCVLVVSVSSYECRSFFRCQVWQQMEKGHVNIQPV